jgi:deoxycytidylate deaminase
MSIFLELCATQSGDEHVINALASVQLPILQRLDNHVFDDLLFHNSSFRLYDRITTLFQYKDKKGDGIKENRSIDMKTHSSALKLLGFLEAANLARRGNQIGSKHGCVITVRKDVIKNNLNLLKVIEKSKDLNVGLDGDDYESTSYDIIVGKGWNHNVVPNGTGGKKRMVHAEVHAVADTIRRFEEDLAFNHIFPFATAVIVELKGDTSYDDAPPCPKCELLLRAVGVHKTCHSTDKGYVKDLDLPPCSDRLLFFRNPIVRIPFQTVCDELCIQCSKLE